MNYTPSYRFNVKVTQFYQTRVPNRECDNYSAISS